MFRRTVIFLVAALACICLPASAADGNPPSTLVDFASAALANHEVMARADSAVRRSEADIKLSSSILMPSFSVNGTYTRYKDEQALDLGEGERFVIQPVDDWRWSANVTQTLFSGLRDWRARDVAKLRRDVALLERHTAAANLILEVAQAFFEAVTAEQRVTVRRSALESVTAQLKVAERRHEVGEVTTADVARWTAEVAAGKQALVIAQGEHELALRRLARMAGVDTVTRLDPPGPIPVPGGDIESHVEQALANRLEMKTLEHQIEAAGLMVKVEKGAWLPLATADLSYNQQKADFPTRDWSALAVNLQVPIYDGGLTAARVAQAREDLREVRLVEREVTKGITDQVDVAAISHRAAVAAHEAAVERTTAAREAHRQVDRAYRAGEASATDLLATTTELTEAETDRIIARWSREMFAISLRHSVGQAPLPDLDLTTTISED